jgi:hypothetical protein
MTTCASARRGPLAFLLAASALLAGCVSSEPPRSASGAGQPRLASYSCGEGTQLRVEGAGSTVRVTLVEPPDPEDEDAAAPEPVELPAAPAGQATRYGKEGYALVIEGREALYMKAGRVPMTCTR